MSASPTPGGCSRAGRVLGPSLDKIIKSVAWRKNSQLVSSCKCAIDKLETIHELSDPDLNSPLFGISSSDSEIVLQPVILALDSNSSKVAEPALECAFKLFSFGLIRGEVDRIEGGNDPSSPTSHLLDLICKCGGLGDEGIELSLLRAFLSAVRSPYLLIRGDCLLHIVRTCYNVYLGSSSGTNQICAKSVLAQIMVIVFSRAEEDKMEVDVVSVSVYGLLEFTDKNLSEGNSIQFAQNFINEVLEACEVAMEVGRSHDLPLKIHNGDGEDKQDSQHGGDSNGLQTPQGESKIREDGFLLFKNICKLSMKFSAQEHSDDDILLRGKILSLELLRVVMDKASPIWRSDERFLGALKQYLCLSLLKNSGISVMIIFQLLCSIFLNLLIKFRAGLKAEIGIFFPMLILRVLENVTQPSFLQKMTILGFLDKISQDPHIIIDLFVNYDCDVDAPNIFERTINGLLKTSLGSPPASSSTLSLPQDFTFRIESVKCLSGIIKSMGYWMDQQLRIGAFSLEKNKLSYSSIDMGTALNGEEGAFSDLEQHPELSSEPSDASAFEQRRAYKAELQKGISLFNKKPSKGIEFLMKNNKIGSSSEEVAIFLKGNNGLNKGMIGDYLGEREEFPLKVMHAYVDSFNFEEMDFGEAIRFFLRGFRLPGEAQKIDRIMEKFAERYCKCNPSAFTRADTAYVLGYSVIMLNTDAHNDMVKDKMTRSDFIRNNRGIDDGNDLPEDFLGALYDQIVENEIKMSAEASEPQGKHVNGLNKFLGLDGILNLVFWKQPEEKPLGANGDLIRHIQAQIRSKSGKSESTYYAVTDAAILKFMIEVCWGPMLAAFSVTLDQSDDKAATSQCLDGFRFSVHVTSVMGMQTQRDAFVTTVAKFTYLHCAADMKQKNIEAMKTIVSIAIEDGDNLHEAWEHVLTCLSRFEHLQLLGDAVLPDASFFTNKEAQDKSQKALAMSSLSKKDALQNPAVMAVVRGGSYDSTSVGFNTVNLVSLEQINNFISNLNLLDQIGSFELNHIFAHSQRLNSEAIVAFVNALCKVAMSELQSATDPRVFCLTKIVEVAHYNMNRIRLVWSRIWNVLSDFFVLVGLSENLSVAIFVMDSLRQLSMKFLEREELANYNFQNEFLRPFAIVMQKSSSAEIRELIVRCISQMVLTRVYNVKSGWKSVFLVFTAAASDERKNIVLLAFEIMEKIVREYFRYITETDTLTFTDCVNCLITFTKSRFNNDVCLNAIAFLRFCAVKLAEEGFTCIQIIKGDESSQIVLQDSMDSRPHAFFVSDSHASLWFPLLTGLSKLASDTRSSIRRSALEVLFNTLKDHGHLFSQSFWNDVFVSVILPIYKCVHISGEATEQSDHDSPPIWDIVTYSAAADCLVEVYVSFFNMLRPQLFMVVAVLTDFIKSSAHGVASAGIATLLHLSCNLGGKLSEPEWAEILFALRETAISIQLVFLKLLSSVDVELRDNGLSGDSDSGSTESVDDDDDDGLQNIAYVVSRMKGHIAVQLLVLQLMVDLYKMHAQFLSASNTRTLLEIYSSIALHAHDLNCKRALLRKLHKACSLLELPDPPVLHFENESYQGYLDFIRTIFLDRPSLSAELNIEHKMVDVCAEILKIYLNCSGPFDGLHRRVHPWALPIGSERKEQLSVRSSLAVSSLRVLSGMGRLSFGKYVADLFPLLVGLVRAEHGSGEVQSALRNLFESCIGPMIMGL